MLLRRVLFALAAGPFLLLSTPRASAAVNEPTYVYVCRDRPYCTDIDPVRFETYVADVLPNEWFCAWGSNALRAGATTVRTFGWWRTDHPRSSRYDLYDDTYDQVYRPGSSGYSGASSCTSAVRATEGWRVEYGGARINAQYRAETGNPTQSVGTVAYLRSVSDGHTSRGTIGPGLCQNGSQWYSGRGTAWTSIVSHYYTGARAVSGAYVYLSQRYSCTASGSRYRVVTWRDPVRGTTFTRSYYLGPCPS